MPQRARPRRVCSAGLHRWSLALAGCAPSPSPAARGFPTPTGVPNGFAGYLPSLAACFGRGGRLWRMECPSRPGVCVATARNLHTEGKAATALPGVQRAGWRQDGSRRSGRGREAGHAPGQAAWRGRFRAFVGRARAIDGHVKLCGQCSANQPRPLPTQPRAVRSPRVPLAAGPHELVGLPREPGREKPRREQAARRRGQPVLSALVLAQRGLCTGAGGRFVPARAPPGRPSHVRRGSATARGMCGQRPLIHSPWECGQHSLRHQTRPFAAPRRLAPAAMPFSSSCSSVTLALVSRAC